MIDLKFAGPASSRLLVGSALVLGLAGCSSSAKTAEHTTENVDSDAGGGATDSGVALGHCDQTTETSANPLTQACGDIVTPSGTTIKLGPYGASMDLNVGTGFENVDPMDNGTCPAFAKIFNESPTVTAQLLDTANIDFKLYSVYRPANWPSGQLPVISWANGTCAQPEGYGALLRYVASHGFFVVAANSREVGTGKEVLHALDFAAAANEDATSPYYHHLDLSKVGVMGHSQGGAATVLAANDDRVKDVIIFNGGLTAAKPFLSISGDLDVTGYTAPQMATAVNAAPKGAYLFYHNPAGTQADTLKGHLVLMLTPERVTEQTVAWWQMIFNDDATAQTQFVGSDCGFCTHTADYAFGENGL